MQVLLIIVGACGISEDRRTLEMTRAPGSAVPIMQIASRGRRSRDARDGRLHTRDIHTYLRNVNATAKTATASQPETTDSRAGPRRIEQRGRLFNRGARRRREQTAGHWGKETGNSRGPLKAEKSPINAFKARRWISRRAERGRDSCSRSLPFSARNCKAESIDPAVLQGSRRAYVNLKFIYIRNIYYEDGH